MLPFRRDHSAPLPDREVKATIVSRLRENPYTQDAHIKVSVHHGAVRLEGEVPDRDGRTAAVEDVEAVPGVTDVEIDLQIAA
jgi:osmotically-inducible protein OsmY